MDKELHTFLSLALERSESSVSLPSLFNSWESITNTQGTGGWVGLTAILDNMEKRKLSFLCWEVNSRSSNPYPSHCMDYTVSAPSSFAWHYLLKS